MTLARRLPWLLAFAATALVAFAVLLARAAVSPLPGTGWEERITPGERCDGTASASFVREPFVRHEAAAAPRCVQWTASFGARSKEHAHLEMMLEGAGSVKVDGRTVLTDSTPAAHARSTFVDLPPGVHTFVAAFRAQGAASSAYFRLAMGDDLSPHDVWDIAPLDADAFYPTAADATRALDEPPRTHPLWEAWVAALAFAAAGVLGWLAIRTGRGREVPRQDLLIGASIFAAAAVLRGHALDLQDRSWDEFEYVTAAQHYLRNVALGDWFTEAWRHNFVHPPNTKLVLLAGVALGGLDGARIFGCVMSSLAAALLFGFGRVAFGRGVGAVAGSLAAVLPILVAHGRICGHESMVLFWWGASMLGLACWLDSRGGIASGSSGRGAGDRLSAFVCVFAATAGVFSRATVVWIFPVLVVAWLVDSRGTLRERARDFPLAAVAGGLAAAGLAYATWPFMWSDPAEKIGRLRTFWDHPWGDIEVYMGKLCLPAAHYFLVAFLLETPALILLAAAGGAVVLLRRGPRRRWGIVCLLLLVLPLAQTVSTLRIGAGRYVIQAWPALLVFAAVGLVSLGRKLAALAFELSRGERAFVAAAPAVMAVLYAFVALVRIEPYPLDYFNELVGGPSGVAARKMFEIPWWGEGNLAAVRALNRDATPGARVHLTLWPEHTLERLRDDLVPVTDESTADYVLVSHLQYVARPPAGCSLIGHVDVEGAPLVDTYHCSPVSPTQLGFGAMTRGATDEAIGHFREALNRDGQDPSALFGLGWAMQAKGDLAQAQPLYVAAASRAAQTGDLESEYFARFDLGTLYAQQGHAVLAEDSFRGALLVIERAPDRFADRRWAVWLNLGRALAAQGRDGEARSALLQALSLRPGEPAVVEALKGLIGTDAGADAGRSGSHVQ